MTTPSTASDTMKSIGIVQEGAPVLTELTRPFELPREAAEAREIVAALHAAADRAATVHTFSKGMGVAAPQIGVGRRVAIVRPAEGDAITLLNPVVVEESSDTDVQFEGCLSFFDVRGKVPRPRTLRVQHQDFGGQCQTTIFTDGLARLVAHEVDHLDGALYIARMAPGSSTISLAEYKGTGTELAVQPALRGVDQNSLGSGRPGISGCRRCCPPSETCRVNVSGLSFPRAPNRHRTG